MPTEAEKSERSSSPAFDSDEDSTAGPLPTPTVAATAAARDQQLTNLRKRSSLAGLVAQSGALHVFAANGRINGILPVKVELNLPMAAAAAAVATGKRLSPTSPCREPIHQRAQTLPKIQEASLLDAENPAQEAEHSSPGSNSPSYMSVLSIRELLSTFSLRLELRLILSYSWV